MAKSQKSKIEKTTFKVIEFLTKEGVVTEDRNLMFCMLALATSGKMKDKHVPFDMSIVNGIDLKVGDIFVETHSYKRIKG